MTGEVLAGGLCGDVAGYEIAALGLAGDELLGRVGRRKIWTCAGGGSRRRR